MLHVWNICQHLPSKSPGVVSEYTIHGASGNENVTWAPDGRAAWQSTQAVRKAPRLRISWCRPFMAPEKSVKIAVID